MTPPRYIETRKSSAPPHRGSERREGSRARRQPSDDRRHAPPQSTRAAHTAALHGISTSRLRLSTSCHGVIHTHMARRVTIMELVTIQRGPNNKQVGALGVERVMQIGRRQNQRSWRTYILPVVTGGERGIRWAFLSPQLLLLATLGGRPTVAPGCCRMRLLATSLYSVSASN